MPLFPHCAMVFEELLQLLGFGQCDEVARDKELVIQAAGGVFVNQWLADFESPSRRRFHRRR